MRDCPHCEESFEDERAYLSHLRETHPESFGAIDRKRLDQLQDPERTVPTTGVVLGLLAVGIFGAVLFVTFFAGGGGGGGGGEGAAADVARTPVNVGSTDFHGTIVVSIEGERIDFSQERYQLQARAFHFENGNGRVWHGHADGITLEYALSTVGIGVTESSVTVEGTTYRDGDANTTVSVTVNGEPVDPATYVLEGVPNPASAGQGDQVRVVVERTG